MANQPSYPRNERSQPHAFYPQSSMSSAESAPLYPSTRGMGPPVMDYRPQPMEIDLNNPSLNNSRTLPCPSGSAATAWDPSAIPHEFGDISGHGSLHLPRQIQIDSHSRGPTQEPIWQWYAANDGPWVPKSISEVPTEKSSRPKTGNYRTYMYEAQYRQTNLSDAGSYPPYEAPSDSGYGSNAARHSVGNASIFSADVHDREDVQGIPNHLTDYQAYQPVSEPLQPREIPTSSPWTLPKSLSLICPVCNKQVKTKSELKKHDLRHTKPYRCSYSGCTRIEGFSTQNDLDRHVKSKHPTAANQQEATMRFRCCVQGCKSKDKSWPRLDNFKSHVKRVHHLQVGDTFDDIMRRAEFWQPQTINAEQDEVSFSPHTMDELASNQIMDPIASQSQPWLAMKEPSRSRPVVYPSVLDPSSENFPAKLPPLDDISKVPTPIPKEPLSNACQLEIVKPLEVFQAPSATLGKSSVTSENLVPVNLIDSAAEGRASTLPTMFVSKSTSQGKTTRQDVSASHTAKLTEAIKIALGGAKSPVDSEERTPYLSSERNLLPQGTSPSGGLWSSRPGSVISTPVSNENTDAADSPSVQVGDDDFDLDNKAANVLKTLHNMGYTIRKDPNHSPKPMNAGSAASSKSENLVTCQNCSRFKGRPCELKKHMKRHSRPYGCTFATCKKTFGSKNDWKRHENSQHFHLETWRCDGEKLEGGPCAKVCYRRQTFQDHIKKDHSIADEDAIQTKLEKCRIGRNCQSRFWCGFCTKPIDLKNKGIAAWTERFDHIDDHFMGRDNLPKQDIQDWIPIDSERPHELLLSSDLALGSDASSSNSVSSGSTSPPRPSGYAASPEVPKRKYSGSSDDNLKAKKAKEGTGNYKLIVFCCQCKAPHNPKLDQSCADPHCAHRFDACCITERALEIS